jgi:hypothetical protein
MAFFIGPAYRLTFFTLHANPAQALGRMFSNTFVGFVALSKQGFVVA